MNWAPWATDPDDPSESMMDESEMLGAARRARVFISDYDPDQPRAPKGSSTGGQWTTKGGANNISATEREYLIEAIQKDFSKAVPDEEDDQPVNDADKLIEMAHEAAPGFTQALTEIAQEVGGEPVFPPSGPVKGKARMLEKATLDYGGKVSEVKDVLRGTISTDTVENARIAASMFISRMGENVLRVKDRIMQVDRGYRDILINFRAENGVVSEVQFNAMPMLREKQGQGHAIYEQIRANPNLPEVKIKSLTQQMDEIYNRAYDEAGDSKWMRSK